MKESKFLVALMLLFLLGLAYSTFRAQSDRDAERELQNQELQLERSKFMLDCVDEMGRTPKSCMTFLEGEYTPTPPFDGC